MRIGLDARMIDHSGIGTYIKNLLYFLPKISNYEYVLFGNTERLKMYNIPVYESKAPIYSIQEQIMFPNIIKKSNIDLFHSPHYITPILYNGKMVATIHDLIHLIFPEYLSSKMANLYSKYMVKSACKKSKRIITISRNTKKDIINHFNVDESKIKITYLAASEIFKPSSVTAEDMRIKYGKYLLYVGAIRPHKNILFLLDLFKKLKKEKKITHKLILIGKGKVPYINEVRRKIYDYSMQNDVLIIEEIKQEQIAEFYCGADLFVFPSLYEGFGLPPLEAMACGCPVVSSQASSLPEVIGDAGIQVNPADKEQFLNSVYIVLTDEKIRKELIEKGYKRVKLFSWEKTAKETLSVYEEVLQ